MTLFQLAEELRRRYENAKRNEVVLEIALFGIDYGKEIREKGYLIKDIVTLSGINQSYATEVTKGVKLSSYVIRNTFE